MSDDRVVVNVPGLGERAFDKVEHEEFPPRPGDSGEDVFKERRYRLKRARAHVERPFEQGVHLDHLANWQLAVILVVSVFDDLPTTVEAPRTGSWHVLRNQFVHVLDVDVIDSVRSYTSETDGLSYLDWSDTELPYVRESKKWNHRKTYVDRRHLNFLPKDSVVHDFITFLDAVERALNEWYEGLG